MRRSIGSSRLLRCVLAALLVFAQIFAAVHAVGHLADLNTPPRAEHSASRGAPDGGVPVAERHGACLLCLVAADLSSMLPSAVPVMATAVLPSALPADPELVPGALRLPRPQARGPPASP